MLRGVQAHLQDPPTAAVKDPVLVGRKILVVEDNEISRRILAGILKKQDLAVTSVDSGEAAIAAYPDLLPDMIILDVGLPGIDGFETCRQLIAKYGDALAPVLFVTGKDSDNDVATGFAAGGSDYVAKPVREKEVIARVRTHLFNRQLSHQRQTLLDDKSRLMGMVAHDLRNPLASVLALSEFMRSGSAGELSTAQKQMVKLIHEASKTMLGLVNDLLDTSIIEDGQLILKRERQDLRGLVGLAVEMAMISANPKGTEIKYTSAEYDVQASVDASKFRQVIDNLLSNAVKYSPQKSIITVEVKWGARGPIVSVRDQGPGIAESERGRLFHAYGKLSAKPTGGEQSTGLGLAISRKIIEAHGGLISAENQVQGGCEFRVELPESEETPSVG